MTDREQSVYFETGFTPPDKAEEYYVERLAKQKIDDNLNKKPKRNRRRPSRSQDFENDGDYADEMAQLPPDFETHQDATEEVIVVNPLLKGADIARASLKQAKLDRVLTAEEIDAQRQAEANRILKDIQKRILG